MGIKRIKKEFNIEHIVQRRGEKILIGSPYCSDLISIDIQTGALSHSAVMTPGKYEVGKIYNSMADYQKQKPLEFLSIIQQPDDHEKLITVYTEGKCGKIKKTQCEELGWPNLTVEGEIMHDNTFFIKRADAVKFRIKEQKCEIKWSVKYLRGKTKEFFKAVNRFFWDVLVLIRLILLRGF